MLVDIIEGSFPKQAGVLTTNYLGKPGLFIGVKDVHKVMRCYYVRSAVEGLETVIDDPKKPTVKMGLKDGNLIIAKVSVADLNNIKIAIALGPDNTIPVVNFLPEKKKGWPAKAEGGIEAFHAKQQRRQRMLAIIGIFGIIYIWMFSTMGENAVPNVATHAPPVQSAVTPVIPNAQNAQQASVSTESVSVNIAPASDRMGPILDRVRSYEAFIDGAQEEFKTLNPKNIDMDKLRSTLVLIESMVEALESAHINNAAQNEADKVYLKKMADKTAKFQLQVLPKLRKAYQYTAGSILWEHDVSVTVGGEGNRTVTYTGVVFASNRGIKQVQESLQDIQLRLRFKQSRFRWMQEGDVTYFNLQPPSDTALMVYRNGSLMAIK